MTNELDAQFNQIIQELVAQGEDKEEMGYWSDIFPDLPEEKRQELLRLFQEELEKLKAL